MKRFIAITLILFCTACADIIPSFLDDNQSHRIINVYQLATNFDCQQEQKPQALAISRELQWFQLYSESKGFLQRDVLALIKPMQETTNEWVVRENPSVSYCNIKKNILIVQAKLASSVVLGRF